MKSLNYYYVSLSFSNKTFLRFIEPHSPPPPMKVKNCMIKFWRKLLSKILSSYWKYSAPVLYILPSSYPKVCCPYPKFCYPTVRYSAIFLSSTYSAKLLSNLRLFFCPTVCQSFIIQSHTLPSSFPLLCRPPL
jgi:hypothetical protein